MPVVRLGKHTGTVSDPRLCVFFGSSTPQKKFTFTSFICCKSTNYTLNSRCQCSKCQTRTFFFFPMPDYHCSLVEDDSFHCGISSRPTVWMNVMTALCDSLNPSRPNLFVRCQLENGKSSPNEKDFISATSSRSIPVVLASQ